MAVELIRRVAGEGHSVSYMIVIGGGSLRSTPPASWRRRSFPQYDVNLRSAVSIARRLQDPLAELVKIDPKAIGVGQYQHDMPQKQLEEALSGVVEDCVNAVGVDINTASPSAAAAGVGAQRRHGEKRGGLPGGKRRRSPPAPRLQKVPKLGPEGLPAVCGLPPGAGEPGGAGQHRRPSGEL